jgi:hypothetical protein
VQNDVADDVRQMLMWHDLTWLDADMDTLHAKAGSSGRQAISQSRPRHVSFLSPSRPPALQQQAVSSNS